MTLQSLKLKNLIAIFLIAIFVVAGCGQIRIAYYFADWYIVNRIDNYLDISGKQEDFLDAKVDVLHEWHRKEEIPKIVVFLKSLKVKLGQGLSKEDIPWFQGEFKAIQKRAIDQISDDFTVFLGTVTDQQIDHLVERIEEKNQEYYEKHFEISESEWRKKRLERTLENLEEFFGPLTDEQNQMISSSIVFKREDYLKRFEQRKIVQKKIETVLRSRESPVEIKRVFLGWILDPDELQSDMYKKFNKEQTVKWTRFWLAVEDTITQKQRQNAMDKIQDYIDTLEDIHKG